MRSTALLLAALAGALVCAQDSTTGYVQAELGITAPAESTSLQESATAAQKTSRAAQAPAGVTLPRQGFESLKSIIEKSLLLADKAFDEAEKRASEGVQDGKQIAEGGNEFIQRLKNIFLDPRKIWFLNI
ncbi:extracellular glycoprotein lacritin isoform X2 [Sturnira hondurensis]|uniref:extracellular glycoprotein lacritin isoform X2 n=1 Tax=Sturnira hondurensis TaxID=192404 RepID=UPI00187AB47D|nr:extracellular glycoprotein lacritin isoform X2 [Sturnira hondurensis]